MSVIRILYVEDDLNFGRMTKVFLDQAGFLVELTTNVEEAWKLFHTRRPDLLLVDLDLEGSKNGIDLIRQIITEVKQYPVIVYSSHTDPATVITTIGNQRDRLCHCQKISLLQGQSHYSWTS